MRPDELLTEISSIRGQAPGFIASDSRENALFFSDLYFNTLVSTLVFE